MIHYYSYTLSNSFTNEPFYVGKSKNPDARYRSHKYNSHNPNLKEYGYDLYVAIRELHAVNQDFVLTILEEGVGDLQAAKQRENHLIALYRQDFLLINIRGGGDIVDGLSDDTRRKMSKPKINSDKIALANKSRGKAVLQLAMDGSFIAKHKLISDAVKASGCFGSSISACCHKKRPSAGGYKWKFVSEHNVDTKHEILNSGKAQVFTMKTDIGT